MSAPFAHHVSQPAHPPAPASAVPPHAYPAYAPHPPSAPHPSLAQPLPAPDQAPSVPLPPVPVPHLDVAGMLGRAA